MAETMRKCVPQRQSHGDIAFLISSSAGMRVLLQEGGDRHDHPVRAVAALRGLVLDERLLQRVRLLDRAEPLERGDRLVRSRVDRRDARANRLAADVDGAGPALREPAAEARPVQVGARFAGRTGAACPATPSRRDACRSR